jgi:transposase
MARISRSALVRFQATLKTDAAIGKKFGITRQAVHQLRRKYGIPFNRNKYRERNALVTSLFRKGASGAAVARKVRLSLSQVYRILKTQRRRR